LLVITPALAAAEIYRWTDANGQIHFGEQPPAGVDSDWVKPPPPPAISPELGIEQRKKFEQRQTDYTNDRLNQQEVQAQATADDDARAKNCANARRAIESLNQSMNKRVLDEAGSYVERSDRQAKLKQAEESAQSWCD